MALISQKKVVKFAIFAGMVAASVAIIWRVTKVRDVVTGAVPVTTALSPGYWLDRNRA